MQKTHNNYIITNDTDVTVISSPSGHVIHKLTKPKDSAKRLEEAFAWIDKNLPTITARGFALNEFTDRYGNKCSLQKSSVATDDCIWLGVDDPRIEERVPNGVGWRKVELPKDVLISSRMHLTREMVRSLLPALQLFVETGEIT